MVRFVQVFSDKTATSLISSALVAYPAHVVLLNFSEEYKKKLIQSKQSLLEFLPVETDKSEGVREADIRWPRKSVYDYFTSQVLDAD